MARRKPRPGDERFYDDIPVEVVYDATKNPDWQAGYKAAKAGEAKDESKPMNWKYGWEQATYEQSK